MTHVIVHAGFHKTGTTSVQDFFAANRTALRPYVDYHGQGDSLHRSAVAARIFAKKPFPWRLGTFRRAFARDLAALPDAPVILLSREHYSGVMPGHRSWSGRSIRRFSRAAKPLSRAISAELRARFGPDVQITFFYTTRGFDSWIDSVHGHLLRTKDLTEDAASFRARFSVKDGPEAEARRMSRYLAPIPVVTAALEDHGDSREGCASVLLDLIDVPEEVRASLAPARHANAGPGTETRDALRDLNQRDMTKAARQAAKAALLARG
ncbi:hypothetical protein [Maritimibacter sp. DP1N21-5]|uniref:hypothetical protein n=1 Tax=Maritimibacter sp. DP1N21-5 TaxID=2836867 RepID=UPI001C45D8A4|nr:hypothetical protein [Maritimibacter sp. DP1N21-5]MBV7408000.1 hypothetical protein [Maritimibacter sp. DP1N21-5]